MQVSDNLKDEILGSQQQAAPNEDLFVVGFNGANSDKVRKVVWAGRIAHVMTFEHAFKTLTGRKYEQMREHKYSPLHLG